MNAKKRYFRNRITIDILPVGSLWIMEDEYIMLAEGKKDLAVYYETHEHWFEEIVEDPTRG